VDLGRRPRDRKGKQRDVRGKTERGKDGWEEGEGKRKGVTGRKERRFHTGIYFSHFQPRS